MGSACSKKAAVTEPDTNTVLTAPGPAGEAPKPADKVLKRLTDVFNSIENNQDGTVRKDELLAKATGLIEDVVFGKWVEEAGFNVRWHDFLDLATQKDGWITLEEFLAHARAAVVAGGPVPADEEVLKKLKSIFDGIDTDENGAVSKAELTAKLNSDKDEQGLIKDDTFGKLVEKAGFNPDWHAFDELDTNTDGRISWDEFKAHLRKELAADEKVLRQLKSIFNSIETDDNGTVSKAELTEKLNSDKEEHGLIEDATFGKLVEDAGFNPLWHAFEGLDTNTHGRIAWDEFEAHLRKGLSAPERILRQLKSIFDSVEADQDGTVSKAELTEKWNSDNDEHSLVKDAAFGELVEEAGFNPLWHAFDQLDTSKEGRITWDEFEANLRKAADEVVEVSPIVEVEDGKTCGCGWF